MRPGELRHAEWQEIDFEEKEWRIPSQKMKRWEPHIETNITKLTPYKYRY